MAHRRGPRLGIASAVIPTTAEPEVAMRPQHDPKSESASPSNLPLVTLLIVIAFWYAWGTALVLIDVL
jgi:hypothetical protein